MTKPNLYKLHNQEAIERFFSERRLDAQSTAYLRCHSKRYSHLLALLTKLRQSIPSDHVRIADIGPSFFTELLAQHFTSDELTTIGFTHDESRGAHLPSGVRLPEESFIHFDLNETSRRNRWPMIRAVHIVVMAEVIEHLHVAPSHLFRFLHSILADGGFLILQTPNAASLIKRLTLLFGRNPYEMIRENAENPGHFHEYTRRELEELAHSAGFSIHLFQNINYFNRLNSLERLYGFAQAIAPASMRDGMTIVLRKN